MCEWLLHAVPVSLSSLPESMSPAAVRPEITPWVAKAALSRDASCDGTFA
jgi:hypothetical protein